MDILPCKHASVIFINRHQEPYDDCSKYYTKEAMLNTYQHIVHPIADEDTWQIPEDVKNIQVLPLKGKVKLERPRKRRIKSVFEPSTKIDVVDVESMNKIEKLVETTQDNDH